MFWLELSFRYGRTVQELQQQIDSEHFAELLAYEDLNPHAPWRLDFYLAQLTAAVYNSQPGRKKAVSVKDFMLDFDKAHETPQERMDKMLQKAKAITKAFAGTSK